MYGYSYLANLLILGLGNGDNNGVTIVKTMGVYIHWTVILD